MDCTETLSHSVGVVVYGIAPESSERVNVDAMTLWLQGGDTRS